MTRPLTITAQGNAQISTAQSKFGGASALLDGTGDYLNIDSTTELAFGTGDFCMEAWIYKTGGTSYHTIFDMRTNGSDGGGIILGINNVNQIYMYYNFGYRVTTAAISNNTWTHIALARVSGETRVFINGTQSGSTYTDTNNYAQRGLHIGADPLGNYAFPGYMDDIRVSKGAGRYSSTFTPSVYPLNNDAYTSLLINANGFNASTVFLDNVYEQTDSDGLYIVDEYLTPDGYYVYVAEAASAQTVTATMAVSCDAIKEVSSTQSSEFALTAIISHIEGVDIVMYPFASVSADGVVIRDAVSTQTSAFTQTTDVNRYREASIALTDAFNFSVDAIVFGIKQASADFASAFTQTTDATASLGLASTLASEFTQTVIGGVIYEQASTISGAFNTTMTVNVVVNPFATFDISSAMTTDFVVNRSAAIALDNIANLDAQAARFAGLSSSLDSQVTVSAQASRAVDALSSISSTSTLSAQVNEVVQLAATISSNASLTISADRTRDVVSTQTATATLTVQTNAVFDANSSINIDTTTTVDSNRFRSTFITLASNADVSIDAQSTVVSQASFASEVTLSATFGIVRDYNISTESIASSMAVAVKVGVFVVDCLTTSTLTVYANATSVASSSLTVDSTVNATSTRIFDFDIKGGPLGITFNQISTLKPYLEYTRGSNTFTDCWIMSFWAADANGKIFDGNNNHYYNIEGRNHVWFDSNNNTIEIHGASQYEDGSSYPDYLVYREVVAKFSVPQGFDNYHHYLIRVNNSESTNADRFQLWIDGVQQSAPTMWRNTTLAPLPPDMQITTSLCQMNWMLSTKISLGIDLDDTGTGAPGGWYGSGFTGSLHQFWFDYKSDAYEYDGVNSIYYQTNIDSSIYPVSNSTYREKFYNNGYVDLGEYGNLSGLTRPKHYVELPDYTDAHYVSENGSLGGNWTWKKLYADISVQPGDPIGDYTASESNNAGQSLTGPRIVSSLTAAAHVVQLIVVNLQSTTTLTCAATKATTGDSDLTTQATLTALIGAIIPSQASLASEFTVSAVVTKLNDIDIDIVSTSALTVDAEIRITGSASLTSTVLLTAIPGKILTADSALAVTSTLTASFEIVKVAFSDFAVTTSLTAEPLITRTVTTSVSSAFALTADAYYIKVDGANLTATSTLNVDIARTRDTSSTSSSSATLTSTAVKTANAQVSMQVQAFTLTVGTVIHLDPYLIYTVESESRELKINKESRLFAISSESRDFKVNKETREYLVEQATQLNII